MIRKLTGAARIFTTAISALALCASAYGQSFEYIGKLGLTGPEFGAPGEQASYGADITESGWVSGYSEYMDEFGQAVGATPFYGHISNINSNPVSFSGPLYLASDGGQLTAPDGITEGGIMFGIALQFNGQANPEGSTAWSANLNTGTISRLGFYEGAEYSSASGMQTSFTIGALQSGQVFGESYRYSADGADDGGRVVWVADGYTGVTTQVGLYGGEYTQSGGAEDGFRENGFESISQTGWAAGYSDVFLGESNIGTDSWVFNTSTMNTVRVGLYGDPDFEGPDGRRYSYTTEVNSSGVVSGGASLFGGGWAAWLADGATGQTVRVGFQDAAYTSATGTLSEGIEDLSDSGWAVGTSTVFNGQAESQGETAWITKWNADPSQMQTTRIGLYGGIYDNPNAATPAATNYVYDLTESGMASGTAMLYSSLTNDEGEAAWIYDAQSDVTSRVGLYTDPEFISQYGLAYSGTYTLWDNGWAVGDSRRYVAAEPNTGEVQSNGYGTWMARGNTNAAPGSMSVGTTTRLGFYTTSEYVSATTGEADSWVEETNDAGLVVGRSARYVTIVESAYYGGGNGDALWYSKTPTEEAPEITTTRIGLWDATHTGVDGEQFTRLNDLTDSGFIAGLSYRYAQDGSENGETGWVYDTNTDTQVAFEMSVSALTGESHSYVDYLSEEGIVLGSFALYDEEGTDLGDRMFYWAPGMLEGIQVEMNLDVDLASEGWASFSFGSDINSEGYIVGTGIRTDGSIAAFLIRADQVPETGTSAMVLAALTALSLARRRRRA